MAGEGGEHAVSGLEEWQWPVVEELYRMYTQVRLAMYSVQCTVYSVQCTVYSDIQETRETVIIQRQPPRSVSSDLCTGCSLQLHGGQVSPYHHHDPGLEAWRAPGGPLPRVREVPGARCPGDATVLGARHQERGPPLRRDDSLWGMHG